MKLIYFSICITIRCALILFLVILNQTCHASLSSLISRIFGPYQDYTTYLSIIFNHLCIMLPNYNILKAKQLQISHIDQSSFPFLYLWVLGILFMIMSTERAQEWHISSNVWSWMVTLLTLKTFIYEGCNWQRTLWPREKRVLG